jgi:hypothetical protein
MATQKFAATDIKGFSPAVEATQSDGLFILDGRNFVFDTKGPMSSFGNRILMPQGRQKPTQSQGIRLHLSTGDRTFYMDGDGIWEWDEKVGTYVAIVLTQDTSKAPNRWSHAYLDSKVYFCHPSVGILVLDLITGVCLPHEIVGTATPPDAISLAENNGRLGVLTTQFFYWSNPSDGTDFTPALGGGGFQLLADRVSGTPLVISSYSGGFLSWTTSGVLRSEFTGDQAVYRHRALNTDYRPINSFCMSRVDDDSVIILDERGLFISKSDSIQPYAPIFNEFLIKFIRENKLKLAQRIRIEWDELQRFLYVSVALEYANDVFSMAFVYYPALDKWGMFNQPHYGILPIRIDSSSRAGDYYGYVDVAGVVRYWLNTASRELDPTVGSFGVSNLWNPPAQLPIQYDPQLPLRVMPGVGQLSGFAAPDNIKRAAYYANNSATPQIVAVEGLDSLIQLGVFRPTGPSASDEMSEVLNVMIRSNETISMVPESEDWNQLSGAEDWNILLAPAEDWGDRVILNPCNHTLRVIGTLDAETEFASMEPMIVQELPGARYYSCSVNGVWHILEIGAVAVGDSFHIKNGEITAGSAGRLL